MSQTWKKLHECAVQSTTFQPGASARLQTCAVKWYAALKSSGNLNVVLGTLKQAPIRRGGTVWQAGGTLSGHYNQPCQVAARCTKRRTPRSAINRFSAQPFKLYHTNMKVRVEIWQAHNGASASWKRHLKIFAEDSTNGRPRPINFKNLTQCIAASSFLIFPIPTHHPPLPTQTYSSPRNRLTGLTPTPYPNHHIPNAISPFAYKAHTGLTFLQQPRAPFPAPSNSSTPIPRSDLPRSNLPGQSWRNASPPPTAVHSGAVRCGVSRLVSARMSHRGAGRPRRPAAATAPHWSDPGLTHPLLSDMGAADRAVHVVGVACWCMI